jgi:cell division protein ZapA
MPEMMVEIGGRVFEVACEPGQEPMLARAAKLLDAEAIRVNEAIGKTTEKRMLLLASLMLADTMTTLEDKYVALEGKLRAAEERIRIAEAKSAMLAANALKMETEASHKISLTEVERLRQDNAEAVALLTGLLAEVEALTERVGAGQG